MNLDPVADLVVREHAAAPCAVVGAALQQGDRCTLGWGASGTLWPEGPAASLDTVFDLASLTKPVTALTLARCQRQGWIDRDESLFDVLGEHLPGLDQTPSRDVSLELMTSHRSGLEAHREFFDQRPGAAQPSKREILIDAAALRRPECVGPPPDAGFPPVYSDLGYILTGEGLAARVGKPLDQIVAEQVAEPLGLQIASARRQGAGFAEQVAPTEVVRWRGGLVRGVVHDGNASLIAAAASAGHAGMFGDVRSVVGLGIAILDVLSGMRDEWLTAEELAPLIRRRPGGSHCAGFDRRAGEAPSSGSRFGAETFGHLGFTGTSIWIDPQRRLVGVLLTNRIHPTRDHIAIRAARPAAYDAIFERMVGPS